MKINRLSYLSALLVSYQTLVPLNAFTPSLNPNVPFNAFFKKQFLNLHSRRRTTRKDCYPLKSFQIYAHIRKRNPSIINKATGEDGTEDVPFDEGYPGEVIDEMEMGELFLKLEQLKMYDDHISNNWRKGKFEYHSTFIADSQICKLGFAESLLVMGSKKGDVFLVDIYSGLVKSEIWAHRGEITALDWDGRTLLTAGIDNCIRFFSSPLASAAYRDQNSLVFKGHSGHVTGLVRLDEERFASAGEDGKILVWNFRESGQGPTKEIQAPGSITCLNHYEGYLVAGLPDGSVLAYSTQSDRPLLRIVAHDGPVTSLHFTSQNFLVTGGADGLIKFWNLFDGGDHTKNYVVLEIPGEKPRLIKRVYEGHMGPVTALQADGEKIVSGSLDGSVRAWDLESGEELFALYGNSQICTLQFDQNLLITDGIEKSAMIYDFS